MRWLSPSLFTFNIISEKQSKMLPFHVKTLHPSSECTVRYDGETIFQELFWLQLNYYEDTV